MSHSTFTATFFKLKTLLLVTTLTVASHSFAAEKIDELDEIVVTASPSQSTASSLPHNVSIITSEDIDKSNAVSLADLLSREANLNLKSYSGTDKQTSIDIRGMGDTAVSNVLILLDGVRLNESDLSGADLSTIAVAQIDHIEIIRGGGSVMFGDGAVGGVINIITKKGKMNKNKWSAEAARGSYDMTDLRASGQFSDNLITASINASKYETDGFRKNGGLDSRNVSFDLRMLPVEELKFLTAFARFSHHEDIYGLPGSVSATAFRSGTSARRTTPSPFDYGKTEDDILTIGLGADFVEFGRLDWQFTNRNRINDFVIGFNPTATIEAQEQNITSQRNNMSLKYSIDSRPFNIPSSLVVGVATLSADYETYRAGKSAPGTLKKEGDINSQAIFASTTVKPTSSIDITAGIRSERVSNGYLEKTNSQTCEVIIIPVFPFQIQGPCSPYSYRPTGDSSKQHNTLEGMELGGIWQLTPAWKAFASWTKHFRTPNIDELAAASVNLRPQTGKTLESGLRYKPSSKFEAALTVFSMRINDEIYYGADPASGLRINRNYDQKTNRIGAEVEMRYQVLDSLSIKANAGYVVPELEGSHTDMPNVPRTTINSQLEYNPWQNLSWIVVGRYVGSRFDGDDFNNQLPKIPSYTTFDTSLRYTFGRADFIAGINNLFDTAYSTYVYSSTYYPMPERNGFVRLKLNF